MCVNWENVILENYIVVWKLCLDYGMHLIIQPVHARTALQ
jgi:hypothetical protein